MKIYHCWKCQKEMPFLDENEWRQIQPYLGNAAQEIKVYRRKHGCDLETARLNIKPEATQKFQELTGMPGVHFEIIYHHRLSDWGPECNTCGFLLRTQKATFCANCGKTINTAPNIYMAFGCQEKNFSCRSEK